MATTEEKQPETEVARKAIPDALSAGLGGYQRLFRIENTLRELVVAELGRVGGSKWWKQRVPGPLQQKATAGKVYEASQPWRGRIIYHPIFYLDYPELRAIVEKKDNWDDAFQPLFLRKDQFSATFGAVEPARNRVAHTRVCLPDDLRAMDRAIAMLETAIGADRVIELSKLRSFVADGDRILERFRSDLSESHRSFLACEHLAPERLPEALPYWLMAEAFEHHTADLEALLSLLAEYSEIQPGVGSALRLLNWPRRDDLLDLFARSANSIS